MTITIEPPSTAQIEAQTIMETIPLNMVFVDPLYARSLEQRNITRILREWNENALGVILVSLRSDGRYAIIDGQHRVEAARKMGVTELPARVYMDLPIEEEARLYRLFGLHKSQTPFDLFRAGLAEKNHAALKIKAIVESVGLDIMSGWVGEGKIVAIGACMRIYRRYGPEMLDLVIRTLYAAFGRDQHAYASAMLVGMAAFIVRFEHLCDWERLVKRLQEEGILEISQRAKAGSALYGHSSTDIVFGRVFHTLYNKKLSANLLPQFEDSVRPGASRPAQVEPKIRLSQRRALANVPRIAPADGAEDSQ